MKKYSVFRRSISRGHFQMVRVLKDIELCTLSLLIEFIAVTVVQTF